jgi:hypothetical protein
VVADVFVGPTAVITTPGIVAPCVSLTVPVTFPV